jgi:hypothetical protein
MDTGVFPGMPFIASVRYWIKFAHTAKYKTKPHAITITTNQMQFSPTLADLHKVYVPFVFLRKDDHRS